MSRVAKKPIPVAAGVSVAIDGQTAESAGRGLGLTAGAARVALHRAMKRLTDIAERMGR